MNSYVDKNAIMNIIGGIFKNSEILGNEEYWFYEDDFYEKLPKILYGALNNLYIDGIKKFDLIILDDYLSKNKEIYPLFQSKGIEYLKHCISISEPENFHYYFERMKKFTYMRTLDANGINMKWFYDPTISILNGSAMEEQENRLNNTTLVDLAIATDKHIDSIKIQCGNSDTKVGTQAGAGLKDLLERLKETPEIGIPMYGKFVNTITKGARLSKLYLRSAATGLGKTRTMVADACTFACNELYDSDKKQWVKNGTQEPTLFIATEQELDEIQTLLVAFISDVDEEKIVESTATHEELSRVARAAQIIEESPLYIVHCPDFSLQDIESIIKINVKNYDVKYVCYDYLHTSMKILEEITRRSGGVRLREDNVLFMMSVTLKDLCNKYQIFILTATQLNGDWIEAKEVNQNLLRGAKSIADKIDLGCIIMPVRSFEADNVLAISKKLNCKVPTTAIHYYKNRRSRYKDIIVWCENCLGTCKLKPLFITDKNFNIVNLTDMKIVVKEAM